MKMAALIAGLGLALLLGACAASSQAQLEVAAVSAEADKTAPQQLADRLLGEVTGAEGRGARLSMVIAGLAELMADRVTQFDPQDAEASLGRLAKLRAVQARFDSAGEIWFETDIRLATLTMTNILVDIGKDRVTGFLANFAGGVNVPGVLTRAEVVARQTAITEAIIRDIRRAFSRLDAHELTVDDVRQAAAARLAYNEARIAAVLGVVGGMTPLQPGAP